MIWAAHSTFEEVAYLLWKGELPTADELAALRRDLGEAMALPPEVIDILNLLPEETHPMRALSVATAALGTFDPQTDDNSEAANRAKAVRLTAQLPLIATAWHHISEGSEPLTPRS